jgi:hypothetical protein
MFNPVKSLYNKIKGKPTQSLNLVALGGYDQGTNTTQAQSAISSIFNGSNDTQQWRRQQFSLHANQMIDSGQLESLKYLVRYLVDNRMLRNHDGVVLPLAKLFKNQSNPIGFKLDMIDLVEQIDSNEVTIFPMGAH